MKKCSEKDRKFGLLCSIYTNNELNSINFIQEFNKNQKILLDLKRFRKYIQIGSGSVMTFVQCFGSAKALMQIRIRIQGFMILMRIRIPESGP